MSCKIIFLVDEWLSVLSEDLIKRKEKARGGREFKGEFIHRENRLVVGRDPLATTCLHTQSTFQCYDELMGPLVIISQAI